MTNTFRLKSVSAALLLCHLTAQAQIGEYRNELSLGVNGGYVMSTVGFNPDIPQKAMGGLTAGFTARYTCEKYFKSICALVGEVNVMQAGWKESILTADDQPVVNSRTGQKEAYERQLTYVQVPVFARMGWGRERKGLQFFFQAGPQIGFFLGDKVKKNFNYGDRNIDDRVGVMQEAPQDTMAIERKFDYGIAAGMGLEYSHPKLGHLLLEGRYYYGLGDIYSNSKRDFFGRSNLGSIIVKLTYLFDVVKSSSLKIK